ncbi:hypothetical protein WICANDRAFT_62741 [Wickerhamomyces anomalus NRRL Y-366-8]|uniref:NADH-ubiquinone oxidoreductase B15 subunit n=1 Tax=Wickerhamomyces anomalus (strain ATCC 58044 / CBS 1984 / NCYC 433 / NRRL Y-366-8) TaxID=683960 RepID=A0A1E3P5R4_WICAA|nr:uncharacterized protein WICANDRAFT_62741 [Wickerhamomyces anomalus NRRL Y-366-8]ODQ60177.1 hypothetical protein WICANDRAFT_62741 [Wickerhamomyces anomalus NRRL Y-366-8]
MGGHGHGPGPLKIDNAFEQYNKFYGTAQYRFKFTAKNIPSVLLLGLVVPVGLCYLGYQSQGWVERQPKRRTTQIHERDFKLE